MKNFLSIIIIAFLLCLSACDIHTSDNSGISTKDTYSEETTLNNTAKTTTESDKTTPVENNLLPLPNDEVEFCFASGAGAWRTIITLNRDGSFTGLYLDSEMGVTGEGYPKGSAYTCEFSGKFENIEKVNEYSYKMTLTDIKTEKTVGEEWIENEIRYIASEPHGLNVPFSNQQCAEFVFYSPDTPVNQVSQEFLSWWPYCYSQESKTTLSCYGILNVATNEGFFTNK